MSGRGVKTVPRPFPSTNKTPPAPALADDVVTVTPVVLVPAGRKPTGPLGANPLEAIGVEAGVDAGEGGIFSPGSETSPAAKRPRTVRAGASSASAFALRPSEAESVCYGVQLRGMPGKFDADAATRLGVPTGKIRGRLVRGEDVTLDDGRVIRSADVVSPARLGLRFIILDVPTRAHFDAIRDPTSAAATALASLADAPDAGDVAAVIHLAPAALATDPEYVEWASTAPSLRNATRKGTREGTGSESAGSESAGSESSPPAVRHVMAHSEATRRAPVFRSAAATSAKLHAVDARAFPDPKFATRGDADAADADAAEALEREDAWRAFEERRWKRSDGDVVPDPGGPGGSGDEFDASSPPALFHPGQNMLRYTLVPLARAGIDRSEIRRPASPHDVRDALDAASLRASVAEAESRRAASLAEASRLAAEASARGDPPPTRDPGADVPVPAAIRAMREGDAEIAFLGTGSSMPAKYRNVSGIFLDVPSRGSAFLDCGEGTYGQMVRLYGAEGAAERLLRLRCVWISHIHADHHVGVVTVLAKRRELLEARGEPDAKPPLVVGPQPLRRFLAAFDAVEPLAYEFADCRAALAEEWDRTEPNGDADGEEAAGARGPGPAAGKRSAYDNSSAHAAIRDACAELGLARLVAAPVVHCAQAYAVSLESEPIRAGVSGEKEKEEEDVGGETRNRGEDENGRGVEGDDGSDGSFSSVPGWKIVYSGDTRPCESLTELARGATALIHEATFENGMEEDAVKKRHSTTREAIECGLAAGAYRTILTHFSQRYPKAPVFDDHYTERTAVAFDLMRVDMKSLPRLPSLLPAVRALFPDDREEEEEEDKGQEEGAVER